MYPLGLCFVKKNLDIVLFKGTGFKLGPVTGTMLADLAQGVKKRYTAKNLEYELITTSILERKT